MSRVRIGRTGLVAVIAAVLVAFAVAVFAGVSFSSSSTVETLRPGSTAPGWSGRSLTGVPLSSGADRGHWVVLNFFATWCDDCRLETPAIEAFVTSRAGSDVRVVSVLHADSDSDARRFVAAHGVTWPVVSAGAAADAIAQHFQLAGGLPQTDVIAPDGRLAVQLAGAVTEAQLQRITAGHGR
jgi:thiol-disulfide isomerase/thioredoxin